jgi:hypothetical protein
MSCDWRIFFDTKLTEKSLIIMDGIDTGTQFNFEYAPGVTLDQMMGFEMAGQFWSEYLADNVSINIFVEMTDTLPENVIGGALPGIEDRVRYSTFRQKLSQDITSNVDSLINYNQQNDLDKFTAYFEAEYDTNGYYKVDNNQYMKMTRANAKALDIIDPHDSGLDGYILMSDLSNLTFNQDSDSSNDLKWHYGFDSNTVPDKKLDFLSVAIHEIGHTLGFVSGLDQADWLAGKRNINAGNEDDYYNSLVGKLNNATPVDMLRFSTGSKYASGSGDSWIDMSLGGNPYLSFNGGRTKVADFATGESTDLGGDGHQASHWKRQENALGIMDPLLSAAQRRQITDLDKQLFDAIGWDLKTGDADLATINAEAEAMLAEKMGIAVTELDPSDASLLTPDYLDTDVNGYDDRGEKLQEMIVNSGEVYEWGWKGYWWGWKGYWWGWKGYWQSASDLNQDGFWQNMSWQTIDLPHSSQSEPLILDVFSLSDNLVRPMFEKEDNNYDRDRESNRDWFAALDNDSLLNNLQEQESDLSESNQNKEPDSLLSRSLISKPLEQSLLDEALVMPIY